MYRIVSSFHSKWMVKRSKRPVKVYRVLNIFVVLMMLLTPVSAEAKAGSTITDNAQAGKSIEGVIAIQSGVSPDRSLDGANPPHINQPEISLTSEAVTSPANPYSSSTDTWRVQIGVPGY